MGVEDLEQEIAKLRRELEERKASEEALRRREAQISGYINAGLIGMCTTAVANGRWIDANDTLCNMLGYTREELFRKTWTELTHPDDVGQNRTDVERVVAGKQEGFTAEKRYRHKDGRYVDTILRARGVRGPSGVVESFISFIQDISARKEAERALRASQQALARHFDQTLLAVIEFTLDQRIIAWNRAAERTFGYKAAEILGQRATAIVPLHERTRVDGLFAGLAAQREDSRHSINENMTRDGRVIVCEWFNTPLIGDQGGVIGVSSMVQDVTERVRVERELREHIATIEQQQAQIRELSLPLIEVWEGVLAVPVVGVLDRDRAADMMGRLLERISASGARYVVVDLTGVPAMDADSAGHLSSILAAARLLGAVTIVTGIRPEVAQTMVASGIDFSSVFTRRALRDALGLCIRRAPATASAPE